MPNRKKTGRPTGRPLQDKSWEVLITLARQKAGGGSINQIHERTTITRINAAPNDSCKLSQEAQTTSKRRYYQGLKAINAATGWTGEALDPTYDALIAALTDLIKNAPVGPLIRD